MQNSILIQDAIQAKPAGIQVNEGIKTLNLYVHPDNTQKLSAINAMLKRMKSMDVDDSKAEQIILNKKDNERQ